VQPERTFAPPLSAPKQPYGLWKPGEDDAKQGSLDRKESVPVVLKQRPVKDGRREGILDNGAEAAARYKAGERCVVRLLLCCLSA
jgi:hypothetical protein